MVYWYTRLKFLVPTYEHVMFVECAEYKKWKDSRDKLPSQSTKRNDAARWEEFVDAVRDAPEIKPRCIPT